MIKLNNKTLDDKTSYKIDGKGWQKINLKKVIVTR